MGNRGILAACVYTIINPAKAVFDFKNGQAHWKEVKLGVIHIAYGLCEIVPFAALLPLLLLENKVKPHPNTWLLYKCGEGCGVDIFLDRDPEILNLPVKNNPIFKRCAQNRTRTYTPLQASEPKSDVSTNFTIWAEDCPPV